MKRIMYILIILGGAYVVNLIILQWLNDTPPIIYSYTIFAIALIGAILLLEYKKKGGGKKEK